MTNTPIIDEIIESLLQEGKPINIPIDKKLKRLKIIKNIKFFENAIKEIDREIKRLKGL